MVNSSSAKTSPALTKNSDVMFPRRCFRSSILPFLLVVLVLLACSSSRRPHHRPKKDSDSESSSTIVDVTELISTKVTPASILAFHGVNFSAVENPKSEKGSKTSSRKTKKISSDGNDFPVLAFVTPWNSAGYERVEELVRRRSISPSVDSTPSRIPKITYVSPVWFDAEVSPSGGRSRNRGFQVHGDHNVAKNSDWIQRLRNFNRSESDCRLVPRVRLAISTGGDAEVLLSAGVAEYIAQNVVISNGFDGVVIEWGFLRWVEGAMLPFLQRLRESLQESLASSGSNTRKKEILLVAAPDVTIFPAEALRAIHQVVDRVLVMTYDYPYGPHLSPPSWIESTVNNLRGGDDSQNSIESQVMLGVPFYGYGFSQNSKRAIVGSEFVEMLNSVQKESSKPKRRAKSAGSSKKKKKNGGKKLVWSTEFAEHSIRIGKETVVYPSLMFLQSRLALVKKLGCSGIMIWEYGQGLEYFVDMFA